MPSSKRSNQSLVLSSKTVTCRSMLPAVSGVAALPHAQETTSTGSNLDASATLVVSKSNIPSQSAMDSHQGLAVGSTASRAPRSQHTVTTATSRTESRFTAPSDRQPYHLPPSLPTCSVCCSATTMCSCCQSIIGLMKSRSVDDRLAALEAVVESERIAYAAAQRRIEAATRDMAQLKTLICERLSSLPPAKRHPS